MIRKYHISLLAFACLPLTLFGCNAIHLPLTSNASNSAIVTAAPKNDGEWTPELEAQFQQRAQRVIQQMSGLRYGGTANESEKRSYPKAMFDFLAGNREAAIAFLQAEDVNASDHQHTEGIDYYYSFTLKGQIRKYFFFGEFLDPAYKQRMFEGAKKWTAQDPAEESHPVYGKGDGSGKDWDISRRGHLVDRRNTDNLRAMREVAVYLMAEETGNEEVRQLYQQKLRRYVWALYNIGMGEWDSENYFGHTFAAYLNLYDFAKDPEVKELGKAALDWMATAAALKYYRGGFGAPTKRDHGNANVVYGSGAARTFWLYFGDVTHPNPKPELDTIHLITSSYRPPKTIVDLARKQFAKPVEILGSKPAYENWKPGGEDQPKYWETNFFGHTYQMGSLVSTFADGDVSPFKLMASNSQRGVDYFVANTGKGWATTGKNPGDQIAQYRNLLIWLRPADNQPFYFQIPRSAKAEVESGIWFFQLEKTWLALRPINLNAYSEVAIPKEKFARKYPEEKTLGATTKGDGFAGFALEVGEEKTHGSYLDFKRSVKNNSRLDLNKSSQGEVQLIGMEGKSIAINYNQDNLLPFVIRNGEEHKWEDNFALYQPTQGNIPVTLGWKEGTLRVEVNNSVFESKFRW